MVVRTYAPLGKTPVLREEHLSQPRTSLSAMSAITLDEGKLYMIEQERAFKREDVVRFLKHLMSQIEGKLLIIWDGSPIHRSRALKDFLVSGAACRIQLWSSCPALRTRAQPRRRGLEISSSAWS
jgi:DDE superfamily endonuclease